MVESPRVLIIDDQVDHAEAIVESLERAGYACATAAGGEEGIAVLREDPNNGFDVLITDLIMKDMDGLEVLRKAKEDFPDLEVILVTGHGTIESAVQAMREGATDYLTKPLNVDELRARVDKAIGRQALQRENVQLRQQLDKRFGFEQIIGKSPQILSVLDTLSQISDTTARVLIIGESGTGKELVAKAIHNNSSRKKNAFVALNCAALSEGILESELFGHEKGAFTGATAARIGRFQHADGGTLFLDEVGDMPLSTQIKLLRVIEEGEIVRVGSNAPLEVDVRLLAATNRSLEEALQEKTFREDLYYRLKVVTVRLPPLRERVGDIPLLIDAFIEELSSTHKKPITGITGKARSALTRYSWPGNVRELKNAVENMIVTARQDPLDVGDIPSYISEAEPTPRRLTGLAGHTMEEVERELVRETLELMKGNREETSKALGMGERTLYRKLRKYGLK
ncbi:MAG: sigma-54 dependent transcriptional regulator [Planctomycetota bacterium]|nr:sigma-54 dependent transcriptional regulator [Planctomycetota bacterium]